MGVKELWSVLAPVKEHESLERLRGQTLAVDLSMWVCESLGVKQMQGTVTRPYLRNIFFRISNLLQLNVRLVFVLDGKPPELKWETMMKRQQARLGHSGKVHVKTVRPGRSHFQAWIKECCRMLDSLGIPYVQSAGEAEAMCALLDKEGVVDGCLTDDGDAFLYGARTVYRNFTLDRKDPHVEVYKMTAIESRLGLNREKLVAMATLLGCDYVPRGVPGVGRETVVKLMSGLSNVSVIERMRHWKTDRSFDQLEHQSNVKKVPHCATCKHPGSAAVHEQRGCQLCVSTTYCIPNAYDYQCSCHWHRIQPELEALITELSVRKKALNTPGFPHEKVFAEFLVCKDKVPTKTLTWKQPCMREFQSFMLDRVDWVEEYSLEKILPLMTLWTMMQQRVGKRGCLQPQSIVKSRIRQSVPCYEVQWQKLVDDVSTEGDCYVTVEPQDLFHACYPHLVAAYQSQMEAKKKPKSRAKSKKAQNAEAGSDVSGVSPCAGVDETGDMIARLDIAAVPRDKGHGHDRPLSGASSTGKQTSEKPYHCADIISSTRVTSSAYVKHQRSSDMVFSSQSMSGSHSDKHCRASNQMSLQSDVNRQGYPSSGICYDKGDHVVSATLWAEAGTVYVPASVHRVAEMKAISKDRPPGKACTMVAANTERTGAADEQAEDKVLSLMERVRRKMQAKIQDDHQAPLKSQLNAAVSRTEAEPSGVTHPTNPAGRKTGSASSHNSRFSPNMTCDTKVLTSAAQEKVACTAQSQMVHREHEIPGDYRVSTENQTNIKGRNMSVDRMTWPGMEHGADTSGARQSLGEHHAASAQPYCAQETTMKVSSLSTRPESEVPPLSTDPTHHGGTSFTADEADKSITSALPSAPSKHDMTDILELCFKGGDETVNLMPPSWVRPKKKKPKEKVKSKSNLHTTEGIQNGPKVEHKSCKPQVKIPVSNKVKHSNVMKGTDKENMAPRNGVHNVSLSGNEHVLKNAWNDTFCDFDETIVSGCLAPIDVILKEGTKSNTNKYTKENCSPCRSERYHCKDDTSVDRKNNAGRSVKECNVTDLTKVDTAYTKVTQTVTLATSMLESLQITRDRDSSLAKHCSLGHGLSVDDCIYVDTPPASPHVSLAVRHQSRESIHGSSACLDTRIGTCDTPQSHSTCSQPPGEQNGVAGKTSDITTDQTVLYGNLKQSETFCNMDMDTMYMSSDISQTVILESPSIHRGMFDSTVRLNGTDSSIQCGMFDSTVRFNVEESSTHCSMFDSTVRFNVEDILPCNNNCANISTLDGNSKNSSNIPPPDGSDGQCISSGVHGWNRSQIGIFSMDCSLLDSTAGSCSNTSMLESP